MKKMRKMMYKILGVSLFLPVITLAESASYQYNFTLMPESSELWLEALNVVLAIGMAYVAIKVAALMQGGKLERAWNFMAIAAGVFALTEIYNILAALGIFHIGGLDDTLEFIFVVFFLLAFLRAKKALLVGMGGSKKEK